MRTLFLLFLSLAFSGCATSSGDLQNQHLAVIDTELMVLDLQNHNPEAARMHLDDAKSLAPEDPEVLVAAGYFAEAMGDVAQAQQNYRAAIQKAPHEPQVENDYGAFLYHQGQYQQALSYFAAAASDPDNAVSAEAYENSGLDEQELGNNAAAQSDFARAFKEDPDLLESVL